MSKYTEEETKEIAMVSAYIQMHDLMELGSIFRGFDAAYMCAQDFIKKYHPDTTKWGEDEKLNDWDEEVEAFVENWKKN